MPTQRATAGTVCAVLWVEPCRYNLPFCQYAIADRLSNGRLAVAGVLNVSSRTSAEFLKPPSTSPYDHFSDSSAASPIGIWPSPAAAKSASVHLCGRISGRDGGGPVRAGAPAAPAGAAAAPAAP